MRMMDSGAGGSVTSREDVIRQIVAEMNLDDPADNLNKPVNSSLDAALHEEESRGMVLWAKLRAFLNPYCKRLPHPIKLADINFNASMEIAVDEPTHFLTQALLKAHIRNEPPFSLGKLAEVRFRRDTPRWQRFKDELAHKHVFAMDDLQLWHVLRIPRENKNGGGDIARYEIRAGIALVDFHTYVYKPKRIQQKAAFYMTHNKDLG